MISQDLGQSYLSRSHSPGSGGSAALGLQFSELEGPGFQYKPLFTLATRDVVSLEPVTSNIDYFL